MLRNTDVGNRVVGVPIVAVVPCMPEIQIKNKSQLKEQCLDSGGTIFH